MPWLIFAVVLAVVTLVGHGIWVLLATLGRALFAESPGPVAHCRHCGRESGMPQDHCHWCGRSQSATANDEKADLAAVARQVQRWQSRGVVKATTAQRLLARVEAYRISLVIRPAQPPRAPASEPVVAEVIEPIVFSTPVAQAALPRQTELTAPPGSEVAVPRVAATAQAPLPAAAAVRLKPRRSLGEVLSTFMEERNIRWGELAGGLLIVCSSVALVISIWEQLKVVPFFQFFIFVAVSAALFGIGLYTEHRWKLASTSRGVLIIATLLVPLNFVAMVATRRPGFDAGALVTELVALGVFFVLVNRAGHVLVGPWSRWLTLAIVGNSGMLLLLLDQPSLSWALGVATLTTAMHAVSICAALSSVRREDHLAAKVAARLFILIGTVSFALAVALCMVVVRSADRTTVVHALAPLCALASASVVVCGLIINKGLSVDSEHAGFSTAAVAVALVGAAAMIGSLALAWPMPLSLVAVGVLNFAALATIGWRFHLRILHMLASASLAVAYVVACHLAAGNLSETMVPNGTLALLKLFVGGQTGLWLLGLATLYAVLAEALCRVARGADAACYWVASILVAMAGMTLVTWPVMMSGGEQAARAAVVYAGCGVVGLLANRRLRRKALEYASIMAAYAAALFGATAWLLDRPWVEHDPVHLLAPSSLVAYFTACASLSFVFVVLRIGERRLWYGRLGRPNAGETPARQSFAGETPELHMDRWILRLVIAGSLALAVWQAVPGVLAELIGSRASGWATDVVMGWSLLAISAVALAAALWDEWRNGDLAAAVLLSLNAAVLVAVPASSAWATASALRWCLAFVFVVSGGLLWFRGLLSRTCRRLGCRLQLSAAAPSLARGLWLASAALPVVACSAVVAAMRIAGHPPGGPLAGTWLASLGMEISHLVPMAAVVLGLVVYAVREVSPGYAFGGGLVANLTATGGYALMLRAFSVPDAVRMLQIASITAAIWAVGWLAVRRVLGRAAGGSSLSARPLLRLQVAQGSFGNLLLVATASAMLFLASPVLPAGVHEWIRAVGSPLGWFTLILAGASGVYRLRQFNERLRPDVVGLLGLASLSLVACGIEVAVPGTPWAYRGLMLGWAMYALSVVVATWWAAAVYAQADASGPPLALVPAAALWVRVAGLLAVALGIKTVVVAGIGDVESLWAAGAIGIASAACAAMAVWLRREGWVFTAGLGVNLAASLAVSHRLAILHRFLSDEWLVLWQANVIAAAVVVLIWLTARRRLYAGRDVTMTGSPLLSVQVGLVSAASIGLATIPFAKLLILPNAAGTLLQRCADRPGWFAWLLASAAVASWLYHAARRTVAHVVAVFLLGLGILAAAWSSDGGPLRAYETLATAWLATGIFLLIAGLMADRWLLAFGGQSVPAAKWLRSILPKPDLEHWIGAIAWLVASLALRGALVDAQWGYPLGGRLLAAAILPGALALWLRKPRHYYVSALLLNLSASLIWYSQPEPLWADLVLANSLAAAASAILSSICSRLFGTLELSDREPSLPPLEHAAALVAITLMTLVAGWSWLAASLGEPFVASAWLVWLAWSTAVAACVVSFWDQGAEFSWPGIYVAGLAAIALGLVEQGWRSEQLVWISGPALGGWLLLSAAAWQVELPLSIRALLRLPQTRASISWFSPTQASMALISAAVALWIGVDFDLPGQRAAGAATFVLLFLASLLMLRRARGFWSHGWRLALLLVLPLAVAELGWIWLEGSDRSLVWIHRQIILLTSLAAVVAGCELVASRWLAAASAWLTSIRRYLPLAVGTMLALIAAVLVQERLEYVAALAGSSSGTHPGVPLAWAAKFAVIAVLAEVILLALRYALVARRDPLGLSPRGRTAYVYAAEVLVLAICLHVRLTMPKLVPFGIVENWWTLVVMIVAFCGAGLSELFRRRQLEVLSEPLTRTALAAPLLPVAALAIFLVWRPADIDEWIFRAKLVSDEAVFFLVAMFYGVQAWLRRSAPLAGCSALAVNTGLWLLWHRLHFEFLVHPQLWLIPPALAMLVAEYLNHHRLSRQQSEAVRYLALAVIYVSSTADVFISHVDRAISLPLVLVLMGLSVTGIFAGMLLRLRPFLYLGFAFLMLDLSIMVYHAAWDLGHTWVFWATGIAVGAAILTLFAVFEKRRNEVARLGKP